jgi:aminopeptidase YwaD
MKNSLLILGILLFILSRLTAQNLISTDSLKKHVYTLADDSFEGRSIGTKGGNKAAQYIVEQLKSIGIKPLLNDYYHHFVYKTGGLSAEGKNIIGMIEGTDPVLKNEYIVIGAHYDHVGYYFKGREKIVFNGADDNASGVAGVIELGRAISQKKEGFERSIIFIAFDGEETGLNGSTQFVKDSIVPLSQIKLMMSIDMIGMLSKNKGVELYGMGSFKNARSIAEQAASAMKLPIKKQEKGVANRTDTKPFGNAGIPAIHVFTGTVSPYHKPEDDADLLDYDGMTQITNFIFEFISKIANAESSELVSTLSGMEKPAIFKNGARVNLGSSYHEYPDEFYIAKSGIAFQAGWYAQIQLSKRFVLQPEILYETLGCKNADGNFRTHAVTTPINVLIRLMGDQNSNSWIYLLAGGYYTYNFAGNTGDSKIDYTNEYNPNENGVNLGLTINVAKVQIGLVRKIGLSNLYKGSTYGNIKNNALLFSVGVQF